MIWPDFEKVAQSNVRFNALDKLLSVVNSVQMPVGHGRVKCKCRTLKIMVHLKRIIVRVKTKNNCLVHALIIVETRLDNNDYYKPSRDEWKIRPIVDNLNEATGIDLRNGRGIPELVRFQEHFREYRIVVFGGLNCGHIRSGGI
jgi:hypothetical protein